MVDINPDTGEALPRTMMGNKSPRFTLWLAFFAFSTITMVRTIQVFIYLLIIHAIKWIVSAVV